MEEHFGSQGSYLIDFYHVCEYLSAAAKAIAKDAAALDAWMNAQKEALKTGRLDQALAALAGHIEAPEVDDDQAPVRRCHRYLSGRHPRHVVPKPTQAYEPEVPVKVREWISPALASPDLMLEAQPPAQPHSGVVVDRPVRF